MKIHTQPVKGGAQKDAVWKRKTGRGSFSEFHYDKELRQKACECHVVHVEDYGWIGFIASFRRRGHFYDPQNREMWTAHKTAIKLPRTHPDYYRLWALIADYQARMHLDRGHLFVTKAPADHSVYRDLPNSGWEPSTTDNRAKKYGYRSHRFVGAAMAGLGEPNG